MGTYVCQAFNDVGFAESTGKLQVIGKRFRNSLVTQGQGVCVTCPLALNAPMTS